MATSRDRQRAASEATILDAAWGLLAAVGPDGTSLRNVAATAGCTHTLVARYFGSKDELVATVGDRWAQGVAAAVDEAVAGETDPLADLLTAARRHPSWTRLLVRSGLGDLAPSAFPSCLNIERLVSATRALTSAGGRRAERRVRLCSYAASSLLLGWLTFEGFMVPATRLGPVRPDRRDQAVADAARQLMLLAASPQPELRVRRRSRTKGALPRADQAPASSRDALLQSAIGLFAEHGPASVSVRDIARHAGVSQGLIYRHFGSKEALLAEAIDQGVAILVPAAWAPPGFDFDAMSHLLHHESPAARLLARALVDGTEITRVRSRFPVLRGLLDTFDRVPTGARPGNFSDPRIAVSVAGTMALGSVVWGPHLRGPIGLSDRDGIEAALADLARTVATWPLGGSGGPEGGR